MLRQDDDDAHGIVEAAHLQNSRFVLIQQHAYGVNDGEGN